MTGEARHGDAKARQRFFASIYSELDRLARRRIGREARFTLLDAPGLVHEALAAGLIYSL